MGYRGYDYFSSGAYAAHKREEAMKDRLYDEQRRNDTLADEIERLKTSIVGSERVKEIEKELVTEIRKELEKNELQKLKNQLKNELTSKIEREIWEQVRNQIEKSKKIDKPQPTILNNMRIIFDTIKPELNNVRIEEYVANKFALMGYEVTLAMKYGGGHPDLICTNGVERFYVEVKSRKDGLRPNQIKWYINNPQKEIILYIVEDESDAPREK